MAKKKDDKKAAEKKDGKKKDSLKTEKVKKKKMKPTTDKKEEKRKKKMEKKAGKEKKALEKKAKKEAAKKKEKLKKAAKAKAAKKKAGKKKKSKKKDRKQKSETKSIRAELASLKNALPPETDFQPIHREEETNPAVVILRQPKVSKPPFSDHSSNYNTKEALEILKTLGSIAAIDAFTKGEQRVTIARAVAAAKRRLGA